MVEISGSDLGQISLRFTQMPLEGCSEGQRRSAQRLAQIAGRLAPEMARARAAYRVGGEFSLRDNQRFLELQALVEEYDGRRRSLREGLQRMTSETR